MHILYFSLKFKRGKMVNWFFWKRQKVVSEQRRRKRRLRQVTKGQHVGLDSLPVSYTSADIFRQLNELTLLLTKHDLFLREEHHQKGLIPLSKFIAENFYRLNANQQQKIKQNLEFRRNWGQIFTIHN